MGIATRPLLIGLVVTVVITALRLTGTVDSDVAWQLWIGQRMLAGANLYRDIIETNPPLWFWFAIPIDAVAALLHIRVEAILIATMGALSALSLAATDRLIPNIEVGRRTMLLAVAALALMAMPWMHVGQREQLVLIGTLPYAALVSARREAGSVPRFLAVLIGIGAGLGFALKHYFLIVPGLLELWFLSGTRRQWRPARPETLALIAVGAGYAASLLAFEPDFLTQIVPLIRLAYGDFGAPSARYLFGPFALTGFALLIFTAAHAKLLTKRQAPLASALLVAAFGFAAAYFIQFKGWTYHAIPLVSCASVALAALLAETSEAPAVLRLVSPALLIMPLVVAAGEQLHPALPSPDLKSAVAGLQPEDTVGFLATETAIPWSVTLQGGYRYASRYNGFWMMRAIIGNERRGNPNPRLARLGQQIVSDTVVDFTCMPPRRIIVSRPRTGEDSFDILPFFLRDPRFTKLLSHYRVRSRTSLETYELMRPWAAPPQPSCRRYIAGERQG